MTYVVDLEAFHGPLDLLLYLIDKNEIDIYDIPVARLSDQYMSYLNNTADVNLDRLTSFLVMASYLLNLKSQMLLPRYPAEASSEEPESEIEDPRHELVKSLLEYKFFKQAALALQAQQEGELPGRLFFREASYQIQIEEEIIADLCTLVKAYRNIITSQPLTDPNYSLPQTDISVAAKMDQIITKLQDQPGGLEFRHLAADITYRREAVALFLALLELIRLQKVVAIQEDTFAPITIQLTDKRTVPETQTVMTDTQDAQ